MKFVEHKQYNYFEDILTKGAKINTISVELFRNPEKHKKIIEAFKQMIKFDIQKIINA